MIKTAAAAIALAATLACAAEPDRFQVVDDSTIIVGDTTYHSWADLAASGYFETDAARCAASVSGVQIDRPGLALRGASPGDCSFASTNPDPIYSPAVELYRIPVVVHVIQNSSGTGFLSEDAVRSQIDILNEDFKAIAGTNGANGTDCQIEFFLADEDPDGDPTSGITYSTNNTWFNDSGSYWNSLAWDTDRYLNIYTNTASGALGYVPDLPQGGIVGSNSDRVVCLYSAFGRNSPLQPFHLGRTATHEVGHYLGLYHTFSGGCASVANCYSNGDRICDTNPENSPTFGCPGSRTSCGLPAPLDNYMDYADDICMQKFTPDQALRMRCTLLNYRPQLYQLDAGENPCSPADLADPLGVLDFSDINAFLAAFANDSPLADLALPVGSLDFSDVVAFLDLFSGGCP